MARIQIVIAPDPILNIKSQTVKQEELTEQMLSFIKDMTDAIYSDNAVGFAAIQFGVPKQIIVIDLQNDDDVERPQGFYPLTLINSILTYKSEEMIIAKEGCMSIPEIRLEVPRPKEVEVQFVDLSFKEHTIRTGGWLARVIQHEIDHIMGKTLLDHMSSLKRDISTRKLEKFKRRAL
jgi:peptide deformylase